MTQSPRRIAVHMAVKKPAQPEVLPEVGAVRGRYEKSTFCKVL
jgi:hypothetical protein